MPNNRLNVIAAVAVVALLFLIYLVVSYDSAPPEVAEPQAPPRVAEPAPPPVPEPVVAPPEPEPEPVVEPEEPLVAVVEEPEPEPEPEPVSEPEPEPLPDLNASDEFVLAGLRALPSGPQLLRMITTDEMIRKFVIFTDNVSRGILPQRENPVRPPEGPIEVRRLDENLFVMQPGTHARFNSLIDTFLAVDTGQAMMLYENLYPLLQEAYAEMGYPRRDFTDTLVQAIDGVLEASGAQGPLRLVRPSVMYRYADGELESRSDVEKLLLRLGPENTEKLKGKLREFRDSLAALE